MSVFDVVRSHLAVKIAAATLAVVGLGFSALTVLNARAQAALFETEHERFARVVTGAISVGVRNAMLAGDGISVTGLLADLRTRLPEGHEVHVYDRRGAEVFMPKPPPPAPATLPAELRDALAGRAGAAAGGASRWIPIDHEARCEECHAAAPVRGVLAVGPAPAESATPDASAVDLEARLVRRAFEQIMAARRMDDLGPFFEELAAATGGRVSAAILDVSGEVKFGKVPMAPGVAPPGAGKASGAPASAPAVEVLPPDDLLYGMPKDYGTKSWSASGWDLRLVPLPNEERCLQCHLPDSGPLRGALFVGVRPEAGPGLLVPTLDRALRFIMLTGLGRLVIDFLDGARADAGLATLALYDDAGRTYHDTGVMPTPPAHVAATFDGKTRIARPEGAGANERFVSVEPLLNDKECRRCHGTAHPLRGAVEIVSPTGRVAVEARMQMWRGVWFGVATLLSVFGLLFVVTKRIVVDPVKRIGDVADHIGMGHLDRTVEVRTADEIGRLARRLNEMISHLRERLQLQKFVSGETIAAIAGGQDVARGGTRRRITVFFSDIRGFTSYSEKVEPETVVAMLNRYLHAQSDLVAKHGGDVDKFVGDELVAVFVDTAAAVRCAIEAVEAVRALDAEDGQGIAVGVGVNVGDAVVGAIGHADRMDYTVIGDTVNVGARLCARAEPAQVLVSAAVRNACVAGGAAGDLAFDELQPIAVKGKAEPLRVYAARSSGVVSSDG